MEEQLLPHPDLAPCYDQAIWLYVYRDFSGSPADRAAERITLRFGVTSWPQHFLADPTSLEILRDTGRSVETFTAAVRETRVEIDPDSDAAARLARAEAVAIRLEEEPTEELAIEHLDSGDVAVRMRALQALIDAGHPIIGERALELLATPSDPVRFAVCEHLAGHPAAAAAAPLEALVREPAGSLNPNVLRISAVRALATCGRAESIAVIAPHARSGAYHNGLTGVAIGALVVLAGKLPGHRAEVVTQLAGAYPALPEDAEDERAARACTALARRVHEALAELTGEQVPFPEVYDEAAREHLMKAW